MKKTLKKGFGIFISMLLVLQFVLPIVSYAVEQESIATNTFAVVDNYIMKVPGETKVSVFLQNVTANSGAVCTVYDGTTLVPSDQIVKTGMTLRVGDSTTYTIVVRGDVNKDGKISATDLSQLKTHLVGLKSLDELGQKGADINIDKKLTAVDLSQLKMILVGLELPDVNVDVVGDIRINVRTTDYAQSLLVYVTWPEKIQDLTRQISIDGGKTFKDNIDEVTITDKATIVARLIDANSKVVKIATLEITNIDITAPVPFQLSYDHRISNYITVSGITTDTESGIDTYYFSKDGGTTWEPVTGKVNGEYKFMDMPSASTVSLRMKAVDKAANSTLTETVTQRTFTSGLEILKEEFSQKGIKIDEENTSLTLPDGRVFKLIINENGGYNVQSLGDKIEAEKQYEEENKLNEVVAKYEADGIMTPLSILEKLTEDKYGAIVVEDLTLVIEYPEYYNVYKVNTLSSGYHSMLFVEKIKKAGLTVSGQVSEQDVLDAIDDILNEMNTAGNYSIIEALEKAVQENFVSEENVNRNLGRFEGETGLVYEVHLNETGKLACDLIGSSEEVDSGLVVEEILKEIKEVLQNEVIDWAIQDELTTEELTDRTNAGYTTKNGVYKKVEIDFEKGTYKTVDATKPVGPKLAYTLSPEFPTLTNKISLGINATDANGISKLQVVSTIGENIFEKSYVGKTEASEIIDITENGWITVRATSGNGKITDKKVLISNIGTLLPIKVTISPETPRNTVEPGIQNNVVTGPISVTLQYSDALILSNSNKYQYQINSTTGEWIVANKTALIQGITENCTIYARYVDEEGKALKQVEIKVNNVDNVAPNEFVYTTVATTHSIVINATAEDTALDSEGNVAAENIAGIELYKYSLDGVNWQLDNTFDNLTQNTEYSIYVKAIDYAGNETMASNNRETVSTLPLPKANEVIQFNYSNTGLTKNPVVVTMSMPTVLDTSHKIEYQISDNEAELEPTKWVEGSEFTTTDNVRVYVRIKDIRGQVSLTRDYALGEVANIDNLAPVDFTPELIASTDNSLTIQASTENEGAAVDASATTTSASSGIANYIYYIIPSSGAVTKSAVMTGTTIQFTGLTSGSLYNVYVEATDNVGNIRTSKMIAVATNAKVGEYVNTPTTITDLFTNYGYDNPLIPTGFMPFDTDTAVWGDGTTTPSGVNEGLVIKDGNENKYVWVPVDGTNLEYAKLDEAGTVTDGDNPLLNNEEIDDEASVTNRGGFYVASFETGKSSGNAVTSKGETPYTSVRYDVAKEKAESMYEDNHNVQGALINGTQWDTIMNWIEAANDPEGITLDTKTDSSTWGNYSSEKDVTGSNENYKVKNIYDLAGNVQEITNEFNANQVVIRGGAYDNVLAAASRTTYLEEYVAENLGFRTVIYVVNENEYDPSGDGILGIGNYNEGPGNVTVNGGEGNYLNPVVPVGFRAINTTGAKWNGVTPEGWNAGLVIEDYDGNQFVWVPVNNTSVKYEKSYTVFLNDDDFSTEISGDDVLAMLAELGDEEKTQVDLYGGFYIARYEAGIDEEQLGSKAGLKVVNGITYNEAKVYAENMYDTPYVKSGLPTGTQWDTLTTWVSNTAGESYVRSSQKTFGNNYWSTFTFSGAYATGPTSYTEVRGEYTTGSNITKLERERMLLATGLVGEFKVNNIYDLAGNVWEYSAEYTEVDTIKSHVVRGGDYYRVYTQNSVWGIGMREDLDSTVGEARNEGGFRVVLYLTSQESEIGKYEDYNRTLDGNEANYNNPVIPAGYAAVNTGATWGAENAWNSGLVISDKLGNEFIWVPVDGENVQYKKWIERGISYKDTEGDEIPSILTEWEETEKTQVERYGGFYVARYETSKDTEGVLESVAGAETLTNVTYDEAKALLETYETCDTVEVGILTGTQWDTTLRWIGNELGEEAVTTDSTSWGYYSNSDLGRAAKAKNIFELAGGNWEMTSELYGESSVIYRGGVYTDAGGSSPAGYRGSIEKATSEEKTTFRMALYITGAIEGIANSPITETEPLKGTRFITEVNAPELVSGMVPVKWDGATWVETTENDEDWYSYADAKSSGIGSSNWANAKTPDGSMWVWIPRYAYMIDEEQQGIEVLFLNGTTNETIEKSSRKIYQEIDTEKNVTTLNNYIVHPAFINNASLGGWDKELTGIWVAKYASSGSTSETVASKPNATTYANTNQGNGQFTLARSAHLGLTIEQKSAIDVHMAKNTEWGAVAYLAYSKYGVVGQKIAQNESGLTGGSNYIVNTNQSTTGNVYGVYDMVSTISTYVAAYNDGINIRYSNISSIIQANPKYRTKYSADNVSTVYGDAMRETKGWQGAQVNTLLNYYIEHYHSNSKPLIVRGNHKAHKDAAFQGENTIFSTSVQCGNTNYSYGYRMTIVNDNSPKGVWEDAGSETKWNYDRWPYSQYTIYHIKCSICGAEKTSTSPLTDQIGTDHCVGGIAIAQ